MRGIDMTHMVFLAVSNADQPNAGFAERGGALK